MRLTALNPTLDFERFYALNFPPGCLPYDIRGRVEEEWRLIMNSHPIVVEVRDLDRSATDLVANIAAVLLSPDTFDDFAKRGLPYVNRYFVNQAREGHNLLLSPEDVARCNHTTGVDMFLPYVSWVIDPAIYTDVETMKIRAHAVNAFAKQVSGYRINRIVMEVVGSQAKQGILAYGYKILCDYPAWTNPHPEWDLAPCLVSLTLEDAIRTENYLVVGMFGWSPPIFGFKPYQKEMLRLALGGKADRQIADEISVSQHALKKRWDEIYKRVEEIDDKLLPKREPESTVRGKERRRVLLNYLREHAEEL